MPSTRFAVGSAIPAELDWSARNACGELDYVDISDVRGVEEIGLIRQGTQYLCEIQMPSNVISIPRGNEAEEIGLITVDHLKTALSKGDYSFLQTIRHPYTPEQQVRYVEIVSQVRRRYFVPTA